MVEVAAPPGSRRSSRPRRRRTSRRPAGDRDAAVGGGAGGDQHGERAQDEVGERVEQASQPPKPVSRCLTIVCSATSQLTNTRTRRRSARPGSGRSRPDSGPPSPGKRAKPSERQRDGADVERLRRQVVALVSGRAAARARGRRRCRGSQKTMVAASSAHAWRSRPLARVGRPWPARTVRRGGHDLDQLGQRGADRAVQQALRPQPRRTRARRADPTRSVTTNSRGSVAETDTAHIAVIGVFPPIAERLRRWSVVEDVAECRRSPARASRRTTSAGRPPSGTRATSSAVSSSGRLKPRSAGSVSEAAASENAGSMPRRSSQPRLRIGHGDRPHAALVAGERPAQHGRAEQGHDVAVAHRAQRVARVAPPAHDRHGAHVLEVGQRRRPPAAPIEPVRRAAPPRGRATTSSGRPGRGRRSRRRGRGRRPGRGRGPSRRRGAAGGRPGGRSDGPAR